MKGKVKMETQKNRLAEIFEKKRMVLIASLPRNDVRLAKAAAAGGADALKIHINVEHAASGTRFGSFSEEQKHIESILAAVEIPVGIMPGSACAASIGEMRELASMGIDFHDIYVSDMPADYMKIDFMAAMPALGAYWRPFEPEMLAKLGFKTIEASIVHHEEYGKRLALADLMSYSFIAEKFGGEVVVPTQKAVLPQEVAILRDAGARGLMIGKIVTGDTPESFEEATSRFADSINSL
jgi:hypothetical protein